MSRSGTRSLASRSRIVEQRQVALQHCLGEPALLEVILVLGMADCGAGQVGVEHEEQRSRATAP